MILSGLFITVILAMTWFIVAAVIKFITVFLGVAFSIGFASFIWFIIMTSLFIFATASDPEKDTYDQDE